MRKEKIEIERKEFIEKSHEAQQIILQKLREKDKDDPHFELLLMLNMSVLSMELTDLLFGDSENDNGIV